MTLRYRGAIDLPPGQPGGFDHADVHAASGTVFVAHTTFDQVEIIINVAEPACVTVLTASSGKLIAQTPVDSAGPHGMAFDESANQQEPEHISQIADVFGCPTRYDRM